MRERRHRRASARSLLLVLAACLQAAGATFTCQPTNNAADCSALGDLYAAGGGGAWVGLPASDGWLQAAAGNAADLCSPGVFTGVTCDASGRVAAMYGSAAAACVCVAPLVLPCSLTHPAAQLAHPERPCGQVVRFPRKPVSSDTTVRTWDTAW